MDVFRPNLNICALKRWIVNNDQRKHKVLTMDTTFDEGKKRCKRVTMNFFLSTKPPEEWPRLCFINISFATFLKKLKMKKQTKKVKALKQKLYSNIWRPEKLKNIFLVILNVIILCFLCFKSFASLFKVLYK